jgi:hypothetical protein
LRLVFGREKILVNAIAYDVVRGIFLVTPAAFFCIRKAGMGKNRKNSGMVGKIPLCEWESGRKNSGMVGKKEEGEYRHD